MEGYSVISIISQAFVIGLTSDFIPKAVYMYVYSKDTSLEGYVNFTLSSQFKLINSFLKFYCLR
jgi:hypothetical protein